MTTPRPVVKKQAAQREAVKPAGKKHLPAKTPSSQNTFQPKHPPAKTPSMNQPESTRTKTVVIHGIPCLRSMAQIIQDVSGKGIIGIH